MKKFLGLLFVIATLIIFPMNALADDPTNTTKETAIEVYYGSNSGTYTTAIEKGTVLYFKFTAPLSGTYKLDSKESSVFEGGSYSASLTRGVTYYIVYTKTSKSASNSYSITISYTSYKMGSIAANGTIYYYATDGYHVSSSGGIGICHATYDNGNLACVSCKHFFTIGTDCTCQYAGSGLHQLCNSYGEVIGEFTYVHDTYECKYCGGKTPSKYFLGDDGLVHQNIMSNGDVIGTDLVDPDWDDDECRIIKQAKSYSNKNRVQFYISPGHYILYRKTTGKWKKVKTFYVDPMFEDEDDGELDFTTYNDKDVKSVTKYTYRLYSVEAKTYSKKVTYATSPKKAKASKSGLTISWKPVSDADGYVIFYEYGIYWSNGALASCDARKSKVGKGATSFTISVRNPSATAITDYSVMAYKKIGKKYYVHGLEPDTSWKTL